MEQKELRWGERLTRLEIIERQLKLHQPVIDFVKTTDTTISRLSLYYDNIQTVIENNGIYLVHTEMSQSHYTLTSEIASDLIYIINCINNVNIRDLDNNMYINSYFVSFEKSPYYKIFIMIKWIESISISKLSGTRGSPTVKGMLTIKLYKKIDPIVIEYDDFSTLQFQFDVNSQLSFFQQ